MKDRSAKYENKKGRMNLVPDDDHRNMNAIRGMVPKENARGEILITKGKDVNTIRGLVPDPWPRPPRPEPQTPHCTSITKKGEACKAAPIRGTHTCVGHSRGQGRS